MPPQAKGPSLPPSLRRELGVGEPEFPAFRRSAVKTRKDRRKAQRLDKKAYRPIHDGDERRQPRRAGKDVAARQKRIPIAKDRHSDNASAVTNNVADDDFDELESLATTSPDPPATRVSRKVQEKLDRDDAEIAKLERKLGIKSRKSLPQSFREDGLSDLLDGLGDIEGSEGYANTKRKAADDEWQARKRSKSGSMSVGQDESGSEESDAKSYGISNSRSSETDPDSDPDAGQDSDQGSEASDQGDNDLADVDSSGSSGEISKVSSTEKAAKYVPPARRQLSAGEDETTARLRRRLQGLLNRLTESNLLAILNDIEKVYEEHPRQHVTRILTTIIIEVIALPAAQPDTFVILSAAFVSAVYKVVGNEFGSHLTRVTVSELEDHLNKTAALDLDSPVAPKQSLNLVGFLAELYNFKVIGPSLIFDYIRMFLSDLSETNAEKLLRVIRLSGPQLRQDDPLALKDIVLLIQPAVSRVGEESLSVRTKFMIDTIKDLKNNKIKTGASTSKINAQLALRMKKVIGSLDSRSLAQTEPLSLSLSDMRKADKSEDWPDRVLGEGNHSQDGNKAAQNKESELGEDSDRDILGSWTGLFPDTSELETLAREQGMNTDVRRSIFVILLSSVDAEHAQRRLQKMNMTKHDRKEIPNVLMQCVGSEKHYNTFYSTVGRKLSGDHQVRYAFQHSLWNMFRRAGESVFGDHEGDDGTLDLNRLVKIAQMYGSLIAHGCIDVTILKCLDLFHLGAKIQRFVEVILITVLETCWKRSKDSKGQTETIRAVFRLGRKKHELATGLRYFLGKKVSRSAWLSKRQVKRIEAASEVARAALNEVVRQVA